MGKPERMCSMEKGQGRPGPLRLVAPPAAAISARPPPPPPEYIRRGWGERAIIPGPGAWSTRANPAAWPGAR